MPRVILLTPFPLKMAPRTRRQPTGWENTFCNNVLERGLSPKAYKELQKLNTNSSGQQLAYRTEQSPQKKKSSN